MRHSDNGIAAHAAKCKKGKLVRSINKKPSGRYEIWTCDSCKYLARGEREE